MTASLHDTLISLFPHAVPYTSWDLRNDGKGDYIAEWNLPEPQPTLEALSAAGTLAALEAKRQEKLATLEASCASEIQSGFNSKALGSSHRYPAKTTDQSNLQASILASLLPNLPADWTTPFWCRDPAGTWAYRPHTAAQIQRVGTDGKDAVNACIAQKILLEQQVAKAKTLAEVEAITWTAPQ